MQQKGLLVLIILSCATGTNNYNQVVRALKNNFGEKRARALLYKLERLSLELMLICKKVMALTQEYERKWLQK